MLEDFAWPMALVLAGVHLAAPRLRPLFSTKVERIAGFGAGMAVSYVFLQLLPELAKADHKFGEYIYLIVLIGFLGYLLLQRKGPGGETRFFGPVLYNTLLIYSLPDSTSGSAFLASLVALGLGLDVANEDFEEGQEDPEMFDRRSRFLLAPLLGALLRGVYVNEYHGVLLLALMAGSIMHSAFANLLDD